MLGHVEKVRVRDILFSLLLARLILVLVFSASRTFLPNFSYPVHEFVAAFAEVIVFLGLIASIKEARHLIFSGWNKPKLNGGGFKSSLVSFASRCRSDNIEVFFRMVMCTIFLGPPRVGKICSADIFGRI